VGSPSATPASTAPLRVMSKREHIHHSGDGESDGLERFVAVDTIWTRRNGSGAAGFFYLRAALAFLMPSYDSGRSRRSANPPVLGLDQSG